MLLKCYALTAYTCRRIKTKSLGLQRQGKYATWRRVVAQGTGRHCYGRCGYNCCSSRAKLEHLSSLQVLQRNCSLSSRSWRSFISLSLACKNLMICGICCGSFTCSKAVDGTVGGRGQCGRKLSFWLVVLRKWLFSSLVACAEVSCINCAKRV